MKVVTGVYRSVCLGVDTDAVAVRCHVPQVFSDETVTCFDIIGVLPAAGAVGWVAFESGYPDRPVWMSGSSAAAADSGVFVTRGYRWVNQVTATDPGDGKVKCNNLDPSLATEVYLSAHDLDGVAFLNVLSLVAGDLLGIYLSGDVSTRVEYRLTGVPVNNVSWLVLPVSLGTNYGFGVGTPGNNVAVKVTVQSSGSSGGGGGPSGGSSGNLDGGTATSIYGGIPPLDAGGVT